MTVLFVYQDETKPSPAFNSSSHTRADNSKQLDSTTFTRLSCFVSKSSQIHTCGLGGWQTSLVRCLVAQASKYTYFIHQGTGTICSGENPLHLCLQMCVCHLVCYNWSSFLSFCLQLHSRHISLWISIHLLLHSSTFQYFPFPSIHPLLHSSTFQYSSIYSSTAPLINFSMFSMSMHNLWVDTSLGLQKPVETSQEFFCYLVTPNVAQNLHQLTPNPVQHFAVKLFSQSRCNPP